MNDKQKELFYLLCAILENSYPAVPSYEELGALWENSDAAHSRYTVHLFERHKLLSTVKFKGRSMELTNKGRDLWRKYKLENNIGDL